MAHRKQQVAVASLFVCIFVHIMHRDKYIRVVTFPGMSWIFISKIFGAWKVLENEFCPGNSWKLKFEVLESPGIYMWFKLTDMHLARFGLLLTETKRK